MVEPTITLTSEQIDFYHREGYLSLEQVSPPEEVALLRKIYERLFDERAGRDEGNQFDLAGDDAEGKEASLPQILNPSKYAPELEETVFAANALAVTRQLLGPDATDRGSHMIRKPAGGPETPWHQDEAYWDPQRDYNTTNFWLPLQDATADSGCMWFLPRSHEWEVLPHRPIGGNVAVHGLELDVEVDLSAAVCCPLPAGGCTIHKSRTLHYTGANRTDHPRLAYIRGGGLTAGDRVTPRRFPWNEIKQTARDQRAAATEQKQA
jgi:ectoine hydroxylase-related dioxygenase (phytanoyl-CoA dioxygenase family)